jgi:hypothetical protein
VGANTPRERRYIGAIEILYTDEGRLNDQTRALAYEQTMEQLAGQPDHPGVRRYIMQSYDAPPLAHRGLSVARQLEGSPPSDPRPAHARTFSPGSDSGRRQFELTSPPAAAWVARAAGEHEAALQLMRSASALEASCQRPSVMPGLLAPAHEHLGELLLEHALWCGAGVRDYGRSGESACILYNTRGASHLRWQREN